MEDGNEKMDQEYLSLTPDEKKFVDAMTNGYQKLGKEFGLPDGDINALTNITKSVSIMAAKGQLAEAAEELENK